MAPEPHSDQILVYDRGSGQLQPETVLGDSWLRLAYQSGGMKWLKWLAFGNCALSRVFGWYADSRFSRKRIARTIAELGVDLAEIRDPIASFKTFNEFFVRHLKPEARPWQPASDLLVSPADCRLLAFPRLAAEEGRFSVKGTPFTVPQLLGREGQDWVERFAGGSVIVCRLCPADYHRFHFPASGRYVTSWKIKGRFDSVNPLALAAGCEVFSENCRDVAILEFADFGFCAFVEVGAFGVARIEQSTQGGDFEKMQEKGYFCFGGSSIVMVFEPGKLRIDEDLCEHTTSGYETRVLVGEAIGHGGME